MRYTCASILLLIAAAGPVPVEAQALRLSLDEFIERYERTEPRLRSFDASVKGAEADVADARQLSNPALGFGREAVGGQQENTAGVAVALDLAGRGQRIESAVRNVRAVTAQAAYRRHGLLIDAAIVYHDAIRARELVALLEAERDPLVRAIERLRAQADAGERSGYDRDRIELELGHHDQRLDEAREAYRVAEIELGGLLGVAAAQPAGSLSVTRPVGIDQLIAQATRERADLQSARAGIDAAQAAVRATRRSWLPRMTLAGGVRTIATGETRATGYFVDATVEIPLFNRRRGAHKRAQAAEMQARARADSLAVAIPASVRAAYVQLSARLERLETLDKDQLPRTLRLVERAALRYREGESDVVALTDAYRVALAVKERRLQLQYQAKLAELALWRALGVGPDGGAP